MGDDDLAEAKADPVPPGADSREAAEPCPVEAIQLEKQSHPWSQSMFDDLADVYEAMIDWPKRLAHEEPFYRRLFERVGVVRVVDVACGTGRHAAMFHGWGLRVEGADVSPKMIERAQAQFGEPEGLRWTVRGFHEPIPAVPLFDAAICTGNSLALAGDPATAEQAIRQMMAAVRPGGVLVVHLLNLWRLPDGPCVWQKCMRVTLGQDDACITKGVHRSGPRGYVELLVAPLNAPGQLVSESVPLLGLEAADLAHMASQAGAAATRFFGGYRQQPYDRPESADLIMVAER
jgi:SAM-dependent methyltransferase